MIRFDEDAYDQDEFEDDVEEQMQELVKYILL
jgi:hypothetical protein